MHSDVLAPRSRHNRHVTTAEDLVPVGDWSREELFAAVEAADERSAVVVIDYRRAVLWLVAPARLRFDPPRLFGVARPPALHLADPDRFEPDSGRVTPVAADADWLTPASVADDAQPPITPRSRARETLTADRLTLTVTPEFDVLVPAFDWDEQSEDDVLPPVERRESPAGTGSETSG